MSSELSAARVPIPPRVERGYLRRFGVPAALAVVGVALSVLGCLRLFHEYPHIYTWTELLIGYQGGFVRRGLLGEVAYLLSGIISPQVFVTGYVLLAYVYVTVFVARLVAKRASFGGFLFFVCPAGIVFPTYAPDAYGRKDIFLILAFVLSIQIIWSRLPARPSFILVSAIYTVAGLIHETAWTYFPFALSLLVINKVHGAKAQLALLFSGAVYAILWAAIIVLNKGTQAQIEAIVSAWQSVVPDAYRQQLGALRFLAMTLQEGFDNGFARVAAPITLGGYVVAGFLAFLPLGLLVSDKRRGQWKPDRLERVYLTCALAVMLLTFVIAADWGRFIYLLVMHVFIAELAIPVAPAEGAKTTNWPRMWALAMLVVLYASTWMLPPWAAPGGHGLAPGWLFAV